ncbi:SCO family protein [Pseudorhodobacter sp. E13]|uniref:SCO family protein n=1 Tax=Pseudorhodobacter sp. E13 TaxID=2487931 RepID=UPI000F8EAB34|nr:SCO family protein [Pseudorhodobacter sp. E13]RUS63610.1 SCO family protein [Pseudorhodobacter sp. E13]
MRRRRAIILGAGGAVGAVAFMLGVGAYRTRNLPTGSELLPLPIGEMTWTLTDHLGRSVRPKDWAGRPTIVFFGFTWCPDVCPTTLSDISLWLEELGADADRMIVALISVDPERDTPDVLADYVSNFDPRIMGLTGSADEVAQAAADFRATYRRVDKDAGDYTMDHTAGVFLFHPDGRFASIIDFHEDRRFAVPKIRRTLS